MHLKKFSIGSKLLKAQLSNPMQFIEYGELDTNMLYLDTQIISQVSLQTKSMIRQLKKYAAENQFLGLSSTQGGFIERFFVMSQEGNGSIDLNTWKTAEVLPVDSYKVFINPKILEICQNGEQNKEMEYSASFPMLKANVPRYKSIKIRYYDEDMEEIETTINGFDSRTFQHFHDLLFNKDLLHWRVSQGEIDILQPYDKKLKRFSAVTTNMFILEGIIRVLEDYKKQVKNMREDYPEHFTRTISELNKPTEKLFTPSFQLDMMRRLLKNLRKDMNINVAKQEQDQNISEK